MPKAKKTEQTTPVVEQPGITDDDLLPAPNRMAAGNGAVQGLFTTADIAEILKAAAGQNNMAIAEAISAALTQHMGPRKKTVAEVGEPKTPFNPAGVKRDLKCEYFQNFAPIHERYVSDAEIDMLHQIIPGSYGTPELPIAVVERKRLNGKTRVYIIHPDGKDDRLRMKNYAPSFHAMLIKLVQEAKAQRAQKKAEARAFLEED